MVTATSILEMCSNVGISIPCVFHRIRPIDIDLSPMCLLARATHDSLVQDLQDLLNKIDIFCLKFSLEYGTIYFIFTLYHSKTSVHLISSTKFGEVRVAQSLVVYVVLCELS